MALTSAYQPTKPENAAKRAIAIAKAVIEQVNSDPELITPPVGGKYCEVSGAKIK